MKDFNRDGKKSWDINKGEQTRRRRETREWKKLKNEKKKMARRR